MYPFLHRSDNKRYIKLHSGLYKKNLLKEIKAEEPCYIKSIKAHKNYYLIDLHTNDSKDYFDFLDYLIYRERSK